MQAPTPHSFPLPLPPKRNMMDTLTLLHTRLSTASEKSGRKLGGMRPLWRSGSSSFFLWGENRRICTCPPVWGSSTRDCGWSVTKPADYVHLAWFCVEKETVTVKCNSLFNKLKKTFFIYCPHPGFTISGTPHQVLVWNLQPLLFFISSVIACYLVCAHILYSMLLAKRLPDCY